MHHADKKCPNVLFCAPVAANILKEKSQASVMFELVEGTHFSPILPKMERAFEVVYGYFNGV